MTGPPQRSATPRPRQPPRCCRITCSNSGAWVNRTVTLIGGHVYTLTLIDRDDNYATDPTYTLFDDVTVS